jgi:pentatricopeptide repeat protein
MFDKMLLLRVPVLTSQLKLPFQVILTTLLKVYSKGGLFDKAKELLIELEASGFAQDEVKHMVLHTKLFMSLLYGHISLPELCLVHAVIIP